MKQARVIWDHYGDRIEPEAIEERVEATLDDEFTLRGHIDLRGTIIGESRLVGSGLIDYKTGTVQRANAMQYGGYSLAAKANGITVNWAAELYTKRVGVTKPQPDPMLAPYSTGEAERGAWEVMQKIMADLRTFRESVAAGRPSPWAFMPNPNSMNCSEKYCPAWGTSFCKAHKGVIEQ